MSASDIIPFEKVKEYVDANIPIVPLKANGDPHTFYLYENDAEKNTLASNLSENIKKHVYSGEYIQVLKLLNQQIPTTFWTDKRIRDQQWYGIGCKTGLTAIPAKSDPKKVLLIIALDADDQKSKTVLEKLVKQYGLLEKTLVQNTPHGGLHIVFAVAVDPNNFEEIKFWEDKSKLQAVCKDDCKIELKSHNMQITLDPTRHRTDRHLTYTRISKVIAISEEPMLYEVLIKALKDADCIGETPEEYLARRERGAQSDGSKSFNRDATRFDLTENESNTFIDIVFGRDEENRKENCPFGSIYVQPYRNDVAMALSGVLYYSYVTENSAKQVIKKIAEEENIKGTADINKAVGHVTAAFLRGNSNKSVIGKSGIIEAFTRAHKDKNETLAKQRLVKLKEAINDDRKKPRRQADVPGIGKINEADLLVNLAEKQIPFFFVNHLNQPCAVVKVRAHYEIMEMNDDSTFLGVLRQMWRENSIAENKALKITVSEDMLRRARAALVGGVGQLEQPRIKTHLRVAWKQGDKVLRYDLTNQLWQQIEVSASGVKIIDSKTIIDEIKEYQNSKFSKDKTPIFFQRYSNSKEQVLPTESFRSNILDYYFNVLTNVTDTRSTSFAKRYVNHWQTEGSLDNRSKVLIAKVLLISKFIPDIPHFLQNVIGSAGAMKTHALKFDKRLIDPGITEVHSPNVSSKDIHQKFAQNYYIIFDNVGYIERWLSDLICAVITGTGFECRALWTNQGIVNLILKSCVAVGSVNRVFTAPDALTRLVVQEFLEVDSVIDEETNESNYLPEAVMEPKFEEVRAELLSCIFDALSKAIEVKEMISGKYALGRMADVIEWGEAISQALGYEEREFQKAYENLTLIQQKHAAKSDPLIVIYMKLFYDIFEDPDTESFYKKEREEGYKVFDYGRLQEKLNDLAEVEGYEPNKKGNKLWPRDSRQLAERSRDVSSRLRKTSNVSLEIRKGRDRSNQFILGTAEGVENYIKKCEDEEENAKNSRKMVVNECVLVLKERNGNDELIEPEEFLRITSERNTKVSEYLDGKFRLRDSSKVRYVIEELEHHPNVKRIGDRPFKFKWIKVIEDGINVDKVKEKEGQNEENETFSPQFVTDSPSKAPNNLGVICVNTNTHPHFNFGTVQNLFSKNKNFISGKEKSECMHVSTQTTHSTQGSLTNNSNKRLENTIKPSVLAAITIPILQQPIIVSETTNKSQEPVIQPPITITNQQLSTFQPVPIPYLLVQNIPELNNLVSFDLEWDPSNDDIYCCCFIDTNGNKVGFHIDQFNGDRRTFLISILEALSKYTTIAGYNILQEKNDYHKESVDSDWVHLRENCRKEGLLSKFESLQCKKLDVWRPFANNAIIGALDAAGIKYRDNSLNSVSLSYLGEGKIGTGLEVRHYPVEEQIQYCMQDAILSLKLISKNNFELLEIMFNLFQEIGSKDFFSVCNAFGPASWWNDKVSSIRYEKINNSWVRLCRDNKVKYGGGRVLPTQPGCYENAITFDVNSMYPSVIDIYNISSETINCDCCKGDKTAYIPEEVMRLIIEELQEPRRPWERYWICTKQRGKLSDIMHDLMEKKRQYKSKSKLKEKAIKLLMNSGYGVFGSRAFTYYDIRLTELVTGFARYTLLGLKDLVETQGTKIIYGDTDSLFLTGNPGEISKLALEKFNVRFELDREWKILFFTSREKQYIGLLQSGERDNTTLHGLKDDQPTYFNEVTKNIVDKKYLESFITSPDQTLNEVVQDVRDAYTQLKDQPFDKLAYSKKAGKSIDEYKGKPIIKQIYLEAFEDDNNGNEAITKSQFTKGQVYKYWETTDAKRKHSIHPERYQLNLDNYRQNLWTCVLPILEIYGMDANEIDNLKRELLDTQKL